MRTLESVDWRRVAQPQYDQYDTDVALTSNQLFGGKSVSQFPLGENDANSSLSLFGYRVPLGYCYEPIHPLMNAPLNHPNIAAGAKYLELWPLAAKQFLSMMRTIHPLIDPSIPTDDRGFLRGSMCHSSEAMPGTMYATINCPLMLAEAFVHELAHQKMFALGVLKESARALITNSNNELYRSPIITNRRRPMTAVVHGVYAFVYVTQLDCIVLDSFSGLNPADSRRDVMTNRLSQNIRRITDGWAEIERFVKCDSAGQCFLEGLGDWVRSLVSSSRKHLPYQTEPESESPIRRSGATSSSEDRPLDCDYPRLVGGLTISSVWDNKVVTTNDRTVSAVLNATAQLIWAQCNGRRSVRDISRIVGRRYGLAGDEVDGDVRTAIDQLRQIGLLMPKREGSSADP